MFSSFVKLIRAIFSHEDLNSVPNDQTSVTENSETQFDSLTTRWSFRGNVTEVQEGCGMIEDQVYFTIQSMNGAAMPVVGSVVDVVAERKHSLAGWRAVSVSIVSGTSLKIFSWDHENAEAELLQESSTSCHYFTAKVTKELPKGGILDGCFEFDLSDVKYDDYHPCKGDWVTAVQSSVTTVGKHKVTDVRPLRVKCFEGVVNAVWDGSHGYIDSSIYFTWNVCNEFEPSKYDRVCGEAVEIHHKTCKWRAFKLYKATHTQNRVADAELSGILDGKEDIQITPVDFGLMHIGQTSTQIMSIRNKGLSSVVILKCFFYGGSSQFTFTEPVLEDAEIKKYSPDTGLTIEPNKSAVLKIECNALNFGHEDRLIILEFDGFKCCGHIKVDIADCKNKSLIEPSKQYHHIKKPGRCRYQDGETWIVPGQRPLRSGVLMRLPCKLNQYSIPESMRQWIEDQKDISHLIPALAEPLSMSNYARRFSALLHIEELAMEEDMRQYDMARACLEPYLDFLCLEVLGLAEGRPSLLIGDRIYLSSPLGIQQGPLYEGYIHQVHKDRILLKFNEEFHRTYDGEEYYVSFTFNRTSLRRSHKAVELITQLGAQVLFPEKIIPKISQHHFVPTKKTNNSEDISVSKHIFFNKSLNCQQKAAVLNILSGESRPTPYILFGPPGTGKTITIVEVILQILYHLPHSRILACTPSNSAADLLVERLHQSRFIRQLDMVRWNAFQRQEQSIPEAVLPYCSDGEDIEKLLHRRLIICTCVTAGTIYSLGPKAGHFTHVIIDEAGQATEPESMIPVGLLTGTDGQIVLAGDPMQLGPVLRSNYAKDLGLGQSFLERLTLSSLYSRDEQRFANYGNYNPELVTKLVENYRSHPAILNIPSELFYYGELQISADPELTKCLCLWNKLTNNDNFPLLFHGIRGEDMREGSSPSWFNPMEALQVMKYLNALMGNDVQPLTCDDIGVITPYRKQVEKIRLLIDKLGMDTVKVGSVEEFQGQERLVIIISTVRSGESGINHDIKYNLGFINDPKRFNVAVTRAQALLLIIGNPHALVKDPCWKTMIQYCVANNAYTGCDLPRDVIVYESLQHQNNNVDDIIPVLNQNTDIQTADLKLSSASRGVTAEQSPIVKIYPTEEDELSENSSTNRINITSTEDRNASVTVSHIALPSKHIETNQNGNHVSMCNDINHSVVLSQMSRITVTHAMSPSSSSVVMLSVTNHTTLCHTSCITSSTANTLSSHANNCSTSSSSELPAVLLLHVPPTPAQVYMPEATKFLSNTPATPVHSNSAQDSSQEELLNEPASPGITTSRLLYQNLVIEDSANNLIPKECSTGLGTRDSSTEPTCQKRLFEETLVTESPVRYVSDSLNNVPLTTETTTTSIICNKSSSIKLEEQQIVESVCTKQSLSGAQNTEQTPMDKATGECVCAESSVKEHVGIKQSPLESLIAETLTVESLNLEKTEGQLDIMKPASIEQSPAEIPDVELSQDVDKQWLSKELTQVDALQESCATEMVSVPDLLLQKIIRQTEYYFGDINLCCDKFLLEKISQHPEHYVPLSVIMTFNRMKSLTSDVNVVVEALRKSTSGLIEVHPDGSHIRRNPQRPLPVDLDEWKKELKNRAIAVEGLAEHLLIDDIQDLFQTFASVEHVHRGIRKYLGNKRLLFADLVIFTTEDGAERVACQSDELYYKHHLTIYYREKLSSFCVQRFFTKRIIQGQGFKQGSSNRSLHREKQPKKNCQGQCTDGL